MLVGEIRMGSVKVKKSRLQKKKKHNIISFLFANVDEPEQNQVRQEVIQWLLLSAGITGAF